MWRPRHFLKHNGLPRYYEARNDVGKERPNIITLSWAANVCSNPPSVAVGIRSSRYSYKLIENAGEFVVNIPDVSLLEATEFCGTKSGLDYDKFAECKLTPIPASNVP
jgi:flavin reductase (DIM6/NTAB) family NADH-FMN oxidoreductase RutF